jgi:hypothetical protein
VDWSSDRLVGQNFERRISWQAVPLMFVRRVCAGRDFWLADADLRAVVAGGITGRAAEPSTPSFAAASAAGHD